jgi:hypothetical protein
MYFIREFLFNNAVVTDCVPHFFQLHDDPSQRCGTSAHRMVKPTLVFASQ